MHYILTYRLTDMHTYILWYIYIYVIYNHIRHNDVLCIYVCIYIIYIHINLRICTCVCLRYFFHIPIYRYRPQVGFRTNPALQELIAHCIAFLLPAPWGSPLKWCCLTDVFLAFLGKLARIKRPRYNGYSWGINPKMTRTVMIRGLDSPIYWRVSHSIRESLINQPVEKEDTGFWTLLT